VKSSGRVLYLPLRAPMHISGILVVTAEDTQQLLLPEKQRVLQTCAAQVALALERVHYVSVAKDALVSVESERLRNSLLSAISHDVRTPLTAIIGLSSTLTTGVCQRSGLCRRTYARN
jgi:two-component system sensor histidine kinase KdpD